LAAAFRLEGNVHSTTTTDDGVKLYFEETGSGVPILFVHEFAGDQMTRGGRVCFLLQQLAQ
jgi:hypothetical protein